MNKTWTCGARGRETDQGVSAEDNCHEELQQSCSRERWVLGDGCSEHVTLELSQARRQREQNPRGEGVSADDEAGRTSGSPGVWESQHAVTEGQDNGQPWLVQGLQATVRTVDLILKEWSPCRETGGDSWSTSGVATSYQDGTGQSKTPSSALDLKAFEALEPVSTLVSSGQNRGPPLCQGLWI